jgi:hypothetical protein
MIACIPRLSPDYCPKFHIMNLNNFLLTGITITDIKVSYMKQLIYMENH